MTLHQSLLLAHVPYFTPKTPAISLSCGDGSPEASPQKEPLQSKRVETLRGILPQNASL